MTPAPAARLLVVDDTLANRDDCSGLRVTISLRRADSFRTLV